MSKSKVAGKLISVRLIRAGGLLNFVRRGGSLFSQHPVEPSVAIASVLESMENLGSAVKVLIIDDDPQILLSLKISLEPWGFEIITLDKSTQFWEVL
ncbi:MAG: hypothetical protein AAFO85_01610 [Cyanobacteria bacterium J06598_4]